MDDVGGLRGVTRRRAAVVVVAGFALLVGWNFWLPTARDLFHQPSGKGALPNVDFHAYVVAGGLFARGENP